MPTLRREKHNGKYLSHPLFYRARFVNSLEELENKKLNIPAFRTNTKAKGETTTATTKTAAATTTTTTITTTTTTTSTVATA